MMVVTSLTSFAQEPNKKAEKERKNVAEAQEKLGEARADSALDFTAFKKEAQEKITANKTKIADLKAKKASDNKEIKAKYDKKVSALEKKNNDLQMKINKCDNTKTSKWSAFKKELNLGFDEMEKGINSIGTN